MNAHERGELITSQGLCVDKRKIGVRKNLPSACPLFTGFFSRGFFFSTREAVPFFLGFAVLTAGTGGLLIFRSTDCSMVGAGVPRPEDGGTDACLRARPSVLIRSAISILEDVVSKKLLIDCCESGVCFESGD